MAEEELRRFIIRDSILRAALPCIEGDKLTQVVLENNDGFEIKRDERRAGWMVYCKNKPRDLPIYGLIWEAL